jgi:hypothetical protein
VTDENINCGIYDQKESQKLMRNAEVSIIRLQEEKERVIISSCKRRTKE